MIAIIGAGLSGLTAAKVLEENGEDFIVFESSDRLGGRVKTDEVNGFLLDHGFQVLLNSYEQVQKHVNLSNLNLGEFEPGAIIYQASGKSVTISDPFRRPGRFLSTLFASVGTLTDKLRILSLRGKRNGNFKPTKTYLKNKGFSEKIIQSFFSPFFSGVFLEKELRTPSNYFLFLYERFSKGLATLPEKGMQGFVDQLAKNFQDKIKFNAKVGEVNCTESSVILKINGETREFEKVIFALQAPALKKLMPDFEVPDQKRVVTTIYFESSEEISGKYLILNGSGVGRVNHIALLSNIQNSYAPPGKQLISVNVLDTDLVDPEEIKKEVEDWNLFSTNSWQHIKTYSIHYAQPDTFSQGQKSNNQGRLYFAGDFMETPSIDGAMKSGEKAALLAIS